MNIQTKRTLNEITIDASATPERFFVFRRSNCKYFVNKRYISLKVVLNAPFELGEGMKGNSSTTVMYPVFLTVKCKIFMNTKKIALFRPFETG